MLDLELSCDAGNEGRHGVVGRFVVQIPSPLPAITQLVIVGSAIHFSTGTSPNRHYRHIAFVIFVQAISSDHHLAMPGNCQIC